MSYVNFELMKFPLSWIREYIPSLPSAAVLAETLPMHGLEVEAIIDRRHDLDQVVVGQIIAIRPHPNADKLRLADVIIAPNGKSQEIVCGAPNIEIGQKVPVALLGANLPNGMTIESRPIRGVVSNGMLCAEDELGLGHDHGGILVLDALAKLGTPVAKALGLDEIVLDLAIPANRADLLSMSGLAREVAAILHLPLDRTRIRTAPVSRSKARPVAVTVADSNRCPQYVARRIRDVKIGPSPAWLQQRLRTVGVRSVNNIVDATNYIMFDLGQPLHAFDAAKVDGPIQVRAARNGETLKTLDGQTRKLVSSDLVIADRRGPIALAGVMGGEATEISELTTDIILESAIFDPVTIRRTARRFGLISEASKRFERGIPTSLPEHASRQAAELIMTISGGTLVPGVTTVGRQLKSPSKIVIRPEQISARLGYEITTALSTKVLKQLGFVVSGSRTLTVIPPAWRLDVTIPEDIIDEIGRMIGYEQTPFQMPEMKSTPDPLSAQRDLIEHVRDHLARIGYFELVSHAYYGDDDARAVGGDHIAIANPLDATQAVLRRSLIPTIRRGLIDSADAGEDARLFELGRVFHAGAKPVEQRQPWMLAFGTASKPHHHEPAAWDVLGTLRAIERSLGIKTGTLRPKIGTLNYKGRSLAWAEIDVKQILELRQPVRYSPVSEFPAVVRDLAVWLPSGLTFVSLVSAIMKDRIPLLTDVTTIDAVEDAGRMGLTLRCVYRANDRTVTREEVEMSDAKLIAALERLHVTKR